MLVTHMLLNRSRCEHNRYGLQYLVSLAALKRKRTPLGEELEDNDNVDSDENSDVAMGDYDDVAMGDSDEDTDRLLAEARGSLR